MAQEKRMKVMDNHRNGRKPNPNPEWAHGLRRLYDSVVEEPLPDSFADLLDKLDGGDA